ncbi:LysR family transcriptional regulator [Altererythrobacter sp.]|uniref:LysR family transcriptional regulator n=1 Tax=Altererythrobacter sp. TaxID=1872480 RepID=UPI003D146D1C
MKQVSDIDLRLLRVFVVVVEARGFAAAESYLNVSTSTISIHISNLEKRIGIRLCERGRGGFKLTERGAIVYEESKRILKSLDDYAGKIASVKSLLAGRLVIGMSDALVTHPHFAISEAVRRFNQSANEVRFQLAVAPMQDLESDVVDGRIHAAIGPFPRTKSSLNYIPLFMEQHDLFCGEGHPLFNASRKLITKTDISTFPAVLRSFRQEFDRDQFGTVREEASVSTIEAMLILLLTGSYIGFLPRHYAKPWVDAGKLFRLGEDQFSYDSQHALITRQGHRESLALSKFVDLVKEITLERRRLDSE